MSAVLNPRLETLPPRLARLPVDQRGYPVPFFVAWVPGPDGALVPDFRVVAGDKLAMALAQSRCFICGEVLGRWLAFTIGPMCSITRTAPEPPAHRDCAEWSARNCPFLAQPRMVRRDEGLPDGHVRPAGEMIERNPGVVAVWSTRSFQRFPDGNGRALIRIGEPEGVTWWCQGRPATRDEVEDSVAGGVPILMDMARSEGSAAIDALNRQYDRARRLYPPA